jgi:hypothetical protein
MRKGLMRKGILAVGLFLGLAGAAAAQAPAGYELAGTGRVMARKGDNVIIDVKQGQELGIRQFKITSESDFEFFKDGKQVDVFGLKVGDQVSAYRKVATNAHSIKITEEEEKQFEAAPEPAPAAAAAEPAPAPAPTMETKPAELPKSGSSLPLLLVLGTGLVAAGAGLTLSRKA